jgi:hypothetical protein
VVSTDGKPATNKRDSFSNVERMVFTVAEYFGVQPESQRRAGKFRQRAALNGSMRINPDKAILKSATAIAARH